MKRAVKRARAGAFGPRQKQGKKQPRPTVPNQAPKVTPLAYALDVIGDDSQPAALRTSMVKTAMPFMHARQKPVAPPVEEEKDEPKEERWSDLEIARRIAHILTLGEEAEAEERESAAAFAPPHERDVDEVARLAERRADDAERRAQEMEQRALAAEAELAAMKEREAERAALADCDNPLADITTLRAALRAAEKRASLAEGRLREAQRQAFDMEQRACATEAILRGNR